MQDFSPSTMPGSPPCDPQHEAWLNQYLDGDLPFEQQPALFVHLSTCSACRRTMESVMAFRRLSRQEFLALPPSADDEFFDRLASLKSRQAQFNRKADRDPLWVVRQNVSLRAAVLTAVLLFTVGVLLPGNQHEALPGMQIRIEEELVDLPELFMAPPEPSAVYVFYPGLTIEADKNEDTPLGEAL